MSNIVKTVDVETVDVLAAVFGNLDENANMIAKKTDVEISGRGGSICISGEENNVAVAEKAIKKLAELALRGDRIDLLKVMYVCECAIDGNLEKLDCITTVFHRIQWSGRIRRISGHDRFAIRGLRPSEPLGVPRNETGTQNDEGGRDRPRPH